MKIKVDQIPEEGMSLQIEMNVDWLKRRQSRSMAEDFSFTHPLQAEVYLQRSHRDVLVRGSLSVKILACCVRCLAEFPHELRNRFDLLCVARKEVIESEEDDPRANPHRGRGRADVELTADEMGTEVYFSGMIDLDPMIEEHMNLAVPMRFLCREECKGLCSRCGTNLNPGACACSSARSQTSPR